MEDDKLKKPETEDPKKRGREAFLAAWRAANPEGNEPDDDGLWGFASDRYDGEAAAHGETRGKYEKMLEDQKVHAKGYARDPRLAVSSMMITQGEKPSTLPYAIGKLYGPSPFEGEELEDWERGQQEYLDALEKTRAEHEQAIENAKKYRETLASYGETHELSEEQLDALNGRIMDMAENFLNGMIDEQVIDYVHKGSNYDRDVEEAAQTGLVEGRNAKIDEKLEKQLPGTQEQSVPDLGSGGSGSRKAKPVPMKFPEIERGSYVDRLKKVTN